MFKLYCTSVIDPSANCTIQICSYCVIDEGFQVTNPIRPCEMSALFVGHAKVTTNVPDTRHMVEIIARKIAVHGPHDLTVASGLPVKSLGEVDHRRHQKQ